MGVTKGLAMQRILGYMASICSYEVRGLVGWWVVGVGGSGFKGGERPGDAAHSRLLWPAYAAIR